MKINVEVFGLAQLLGTMDRFVGKQVVLADAAVQGAATITLKEAQRRCPVGTPESTHKKNYVGGTLKKSLKIKRGVMEAAVYTDVDYGKYVEFGTYKMDAQPFLGPANEIGQVAMQEMMVNNGVKL